MSEPFLPVRSEKAPTRTKARRRALDLLFEADLRELDPLEVLADREATATDHRPVREFSGQLVRGVVRERAFVDAVLTDCLSADWTLARMPRVDRGLARIAIYELWFGDVPGEVVVDEAVTLANQLSTDESPGFLNGLLGKALARRRAELADAAPDAD